MSQETLATAAAVGTFVVIAAGTVTALIQLIHLRSSNQLQSFIDLGHQLQQLAPHIGFVYHDLPRKMEDPESDIISQTSLSMNINTCHNRGA